MSVQQEAKGSGWLTFAIIMLLVVGVFNVIQGLSYLGSAWDIPENVEEQLFSNLDFWGWTILILGALQFAAAFGVMGGRSWARWTGIAVAAVSLVWHMLAIPIYPVWSIIVIALDAMIIYALAVYAGPDSDVFA